MLVVVGCLVAFAAAFLSAVAGFGGGVLSLSAFAALFGVPVAVPVLTIVQLASNGSRVWFNRGRVNGRLVALFAIGAVPAALAGAFLLKVTPTNVLKPMLGMFVLAMLG